MRVKFDGVDLGGTLGNVVVSAEYTKADIKADQLGETVLDRRVSGLNIKITTELTEIKNKDLWKVVFPHLQLVDGGVGGKMVRAVSKVGESDLDLSKILLLHPLSLPDADLSGDYKFYKAVADAKSEITYSPSDQARLKIVWNIYPDMSVSPAQFFIHGDPSIGLTAASAGSPSFTGTGNGTMGSVSVFSGVSVTETITATCIHAASNAGLFAVSGSLSGPLGNATVGVAFVAQSPQVIAFTIADGSTDFIVGDQFTVATTAANYA